MDYMQNIECSSKPGLRKLKYLSVKRMRAYLLIILLVASTLYAQRLHIKSRVGEGQWTACKAVSFKKGEALSLKVDSVPHGAISWYQIIADCQQCYKNANYPWEKNPYTWAGFAKIIYYREELTELKGRWTVTPTFRCNAFSSPCFRDSLGSFWIQAVVDSQGSVKSSYGIQDNDYRGLSPEIFRVSIRETNDYIGYITSFYNVPGLFGSVPYQCSNYIGVDCADVLMAALARWKGMPLTIDYNVAMVVNTMPKIAECTLAKGVPDKPVLWISQVQPGDLIAVRYDGSRQFQHIGALYRDANANALLDGDDLVLHAGPFPLTTARLDGGGFDGNVVILRPSGR
jgi:hypothetical protein